LSRVVAAAVDSFSRTVGLSAHPVSRWDKEDRGDDRPTDGCERSKDTRERWVTTMGGGGEAWVRISNHEEGRIRNKEEEKKETVFAL
jgi:hypothetical protein